MNALLPQALPVKPIPVAQTAEEASRRQLLREQGEQLQLLTKVREQSKPDYLERQVKLTNEVNEALKDRDRLKAREEGRQRPGEALGGAAMAVGAKLPFGIGGLAGAAAEVGKAATGGQAQKLTGALGGGALASVIGGAAAAVPAAIDALRGLKDVLVGLASVANPAVVSRYEFALRDLQGVLGQRAAPAVEVFTRATRMVADVLHSVLPSAEGFEKALQPVHAALEDLKPTLEELVPPLRELTGAAIREGARELAGTLKVLGPLLKVGLYASQPQLLFSKAKDEKSPWGGSVGAGTREAGLSTDIASVLTQNQAQAYAQIGGGKKPEETTADNTKEMLEQLKILNRNLGGLPRLFVDPGGQVTSWLQDWFGGRTDRNTR